MTDRQAATLDRLAFMNDVYLPLGPYSRKWGRWPSKANASRLISMFQDGIEPTDAFINSLPAVPL